MTGNFGPQRIMKHRSGLWFSVFLLQQLVLQIASENETKLSHQCQPCRCYIGDSFFNAYNSTIADCSHKPFSGIPTHLPSNITHLNLTSSGVLDVSASALQKYPNLEVLILDDNKFDTLEKNSFPDPCFIQVLSISGTVLRTITPDAFSNLPSLKKLSGLESAKFQSGIFKQIPRLQELSIKSSNGIPDKLLVDTSLQSLDLYLNSSDSIPLDIFSNSSETLHELRIIADHLQHLPVGLLDNMTALRKFSIVVGEMEELPESFFGEQEGPYCYFSDISIAGVRKIGENLFCEEPNLYSLTIHASDIIESGAFHSLVRLHTLNLSHNRLTNINPQWFMYITGLKELVLSFNQFTILDTSSLSGLRMLEKLDISHNSLLSISPDTFRHVYNTLMVFDASYNKIGKIEPALFKEMFSLSRLDLSHNHIVQVPNNTFKSLNSLSEVKLNNNQLTSLPERSFNSLRRLEFLNLSCNTLETLPDGMLESTPALKILDLSQNRLKKLPKYFLAADVALDHVDLTQHSEVEFVCDCTLVHLQLASANWPGRLSGKCQHPIHVRGKYLDELTLKQVCSDQQLKEYKDKKDNKDKEGGFVKINNKGGVNVTSISDDFVKGEMENSSTKMILVVVVSCAIPIAVAGLLVLVHSLRGVLFSRVYHINQDQRRI